MLQGILLGSFKTTLNGFSAFFRFLKPQQSRCCGTGIALREK
jgi:hypothetical protein